MIDPRCLLDYSSGGDTRPIFRAGDAMSTPATFSSPSTVRCASAEWPSPATVILTVTLGDDVAGGGGARFTFYDGRAAPVVTGVSPSSAPADISANLTLRGINFRPGVTHVSFGAAGLVLGTFVNSAEIRVNSPTANYTYTAELALAATADGEVGPGGGATFTGYLPAAISAVSPGFSDVTTEAATATVSGANFFRDGTNALCKWGAQQPVAATVTSVNYLGCAAPRAEVAPALFNLSVSMDGGKT